MNLLDEGISIIKDISSNSKSLNSVAKTLSTKKQDLIKKVYENFHSSIITFTSISDYKTKFHQYEFVKSMKNPSCPDILNENEIKNLINENGRSMYYTMLQKLTPLGNVDILNETSYINFFYEITEEYVIYFKSWHNVTKFHIDNSTDYDKLFLENRRLVYKTLTQILSNSIENSQKFISLQYRLKLELVQNLQ